MYHKCASDNIHFLYIFGLRYFSQSECCLVLVSRKKFFVNVFFVYQICVKDMWEKGKHSANMCKEPIDSVTTTFNVYIIF